MKKTKIALTIEIGYKPSESARKSLVRNLRALEAMLPGQALKLAYTTANGGRLSVREYEIATAETGYVGFSWNSTLSHEIERGAVTTIPEPFFTAVKYALEFHESKQNSEKIVAAKKALAGLSEAERKLVLDSVSKPKAPRKVRDPAQKMLDKLIDGKKPPLPKDGDGKKRVIKSREVKRKTAEEKAA